MQIYLLIIYVTEVKGMMSLILVIFFVHIFFTRSTLINMN